MRPVSLIMFNDIYFAVQEEVCRVFMYLSICLTLLPSIRQIHNDFFKRSNWTDVFVKIHIKDLHASLS